MMAVAAVGCEAGFAVITAGYTDPEVEAVAAMKASSTTLVTDDEVGSRH